MDDARCLLEITFEGEELLIRGKLPAAPEGTDFIKRELYRGAFSRRLSFNVPVNVDAIEASFHNGLLSLNIPKAEAVKPKQIKRPRHVGVGRCRCLAVAVQLQQPRPAREAKSHSRARLTVLPGVVE
jgi:hypothetical protein